MRTYIATQMVASLAAGPHVIAWAWRQADEVSRWQPLWCAGVVAAVIFYLLLALFVLACCEKALDGK